MSKKIRGFFGSPLAYRVTFWDVLITVVFALGLIKLVELL